MTLLLATGLQTFQYESNIEVLFVPVGAQSNSDRQRLVEAFPSKQDSFVMGTSVEVPATIVILLKPKLQSVPVMSR